MTLLRKLAGLALFLSTATVIGCGDDLGPCNQAAAEEVVYGRNGLVATKGQALLHDSCGSAVFCHSASAKSKDRFGAPASLDFDVLPEPTGWPRVVGQREAIWEAVLNGSMPPEGNGQRAVGNSDWAFSVERATDGRRLEPLTSREGKAALRNWLACGAPVVGQTKAPAWAQPASDAGALDDFSPIFSQILVPQCATAGCHNTTNAGGLALVDECEAYAQLLAVGLCNGKPRLVPGDGESYLLDKLEQAEPECGATMPPSGALPAAELQAIRAWVLAGAPAERCQ